MEGSSTDIAKTAVLFGGLGLAVGFGGALLYKKLSTKNSKQTTRHETTIVRVGEHEETLLREQCTRNIQFLGEETFNKLRDCYVVVVGLGGTGSHAAHMLARSGVGHLRFIDFDQVK
jgi:hypothetical protein